MRNAVPAILLILSFLIITGALANANPRPHYTIVTLSSPAGQAVTAIAINNRADVLGEIRSANRPSRGVIWQHRKLIDIGVFPSYDQSGLMGFNDRRQVFGLAMRSDLGKQPQPFLWQNGKFQPLPTLGGSANVVLGINDKGEIVGSADTKKFDSHAVMWQNGQITNLGLAPKGMYYSANVINNHGLIAGEAVDFKGIHSYFDLTIFPRGQVHDLGVIKGMRTEVHGINDQGEIVGWAEVPVHTEKIRGFVALVKDGKLKSLRMLPQGSSVWAINNKGVIVGQYKQRAFVDFGDKIQDLNSLVRNGAGWSLWRAIGINDHGQIVGRGLYNGHEASFLLIPS